MAQYRTKREEVEAEMQRLTKVLGGGWSWGHYGIVPQIILTLPEAQALEKKINQEKTDGKKDEDTQDDATQGRVT